MIHEILDALRIVEVVFLFGPKHCGKTNCLRQMERDLRDTIYIDFKTLDKEKNEQVLGRILQSIKKQESILYLLDHIAYAENPKQFLYEVYQAVSWNCVCNRGDSEGVTRIVVCGSCSAALRSLYNMIFGGCHGLCVYANSFCYEIRTETYLDETYLQEYLDETKLVITKVGEMPETIIPKYDLLDGKALNNLLFGVPEMLQDMDEEVIRQGLLFLYQSKLISFTEFPDEDGCVYSVELDLLWNHGWYNLREDINRKFVMKRS